MFSVSAYAQICKGLAGSQLGSFNFKVADSKVTLSKPLPTAPMLGPDGSPSRTVHVGNLDLAVSETDLKQFFEGCGTVTNVYIVKNEAHQVVRHVPIFLCLVGLWA